MIAQSISHPQWGVSLLKGREGARSVCCALRREASGYVFYYYYFFAGPWGRGLLHATREMPPSL